MDMQEPYRLVFEKNPLPMWVFDTETLAFLAVNDAAIEHYGYSREEFLSMTADRIRPAEEVPRSWPIAKRSTSRTTRLAWRHARRTAPSSKSEVVVSAALSGAGPPAW